MSCLISMLRSYRRGPGGATTGPVVLQHGPTGRFLTSGARLVGEPAEALVFASEAEAGDLVARLGCPAGDFAVVALAQPDCRAA